LSPLQVSIQAEAELCLVSKEVALNKSGAFVNARTAFTWRGAAGMASTRPAGYAAAV
jgi:hypothetical protein